MPEQTYTRTLDAPQVPAKPLAPPPTRHRVRDDDDTDNRPDPWSYARAGAVHRHADPDALALAREVADRRAAASARPVQRGTTRDPDRRTPRDLRATVAGQVELFDPTTPMQLALFGDAVAANEGEL